MVKIFTLSNFSAKTAIEVLGSVFDAPKLSLFDGSCAGNVAVLILDNRWEFLNKFEIMVEFMVLLEL